MASKNTKAASKGAHKTVAEAQAHVKQARTKVAKTQRKVVKLQKEERAADTNQAWAVGVQVEHPAHGRGIVSGHTQTDGVVLVSYVGMPAEGDGHETVADELKLVTEPKPHKPHTAKKFNFPKRKHADKAKKQQNAAEEIGTAQEQHAAYAKRARDYSMNDRVVELNGRKREGNVFTVAREGSGYMDVLFDGETVACAKFVADLRKVNMKGHKIAIGDLVAFKKAHKLLGTIERIYPQDGTCRVKIDQWVSKETRLDNLKLWVPPKAKEETTKFENLPLLSGFEYKGASHVKVGNTSAIVTTIDRETNGGAGATIPMIRLPEFGVESAPTKVRLKKDTRVKPIVSVPFGAESREA